MPAFSHALAQRRDIAFTPMLQPYSFTISRVLYTLALIDALRARIRSSRAAGSPTTSMRIFAPVLPGYVSRG